MITLSAGLSSVMMAAGVGIVLVSGIIYENDDDSVISRIFLFLFVFSLIANADVIVKANDEMMSRVYKINNIICVYADHGNPAEAQVEYKAYNSSANEITLTAPAATLGYDDVKLDDKIASPKEKLTPAGSTLLVPESYLKKANS